VGGCAALAPQQASPAGEPLCEPLFHYVVTRSNLPRGIQSAQIIHAAGESSPGNLPPETHAVCLTVPDEPALRALRARLEQAGISLTPIVEVDAPYTGQLMAL
jgi:hypothetical protein